MNRRWLLLILALAVTLAQAPAAARDKPAARIRDITVTELPKEARATLLLIKKGGPFPYPKDGIVFGNFERQLPPQPRGYYHEYTVPTPGSHDRGARRIVNGRVGEYYYTSDHYKTFRRIRE